NKFLPVLGESGMHLRGAPQATAEDFERFFSRKIVYPSRRIPASTSLTKNPFAGTISAMNGIASRWFAFFFYGLSFESSSAIS
ncbi:MAG: hypothetical protein Q7S75_00100, partial [bacterium]|nr:hypothetical protein [bacterium]